MIKPSDLRVKADQARRLARGMVDPRLQITLRKYADECSSLADELEHEAIIEEDAEGRDSDELHEGQNQIH